MPGLPTVSVVTPTYNRRAFIPAAIQCFKAQTYPQNLIEWIILDDGTDKVGDLFAAAGLANVRYIALPAGERLPIGAKRNRLNDLATGEIVVAWDDDDYYPPERIRKAVTTLRSSPGYRAPVIGTSGLYLYFTDRDEIWFVAPRGQNHCTNASMAYWRSYCKTHRYDDTAEKGEERVFLDQLNTPVIQLEPAETILVICHAFNTVDKRDLLAQRQLFEQTAPPEIAEQARNHIKKAPMKLRAFVKDKRLREFYMGLTAQAGSAPAVNPPPSEAAQPPVPSQ